MAMRRGSSFQKYSREPRGCAVSKNGWWSPSQQFIVHWDRKSGSRRSGQWVTGAEREGEGFVGEVEGLFGGRNPLAKEQVFPQPVKQEPKRRRRTNPPL